MKILLITYRFPPCGAIGAKRWGEFYQLSKNDERINFTVLAANWSGEQSTDENIIYLGKKLEFKASVSVNRKISYIDIIKHPSLAVRSVDKSFFSDWYITTKVWIDNNKEKKFDLIVSSYGPMASVLLGNYAKKTFNTPYILDLRDLISLQGQKIKVPIVNFLDKEIDKYLTRNVDKFMVVSPTCNQKAREFYKKEIMTIYNGLPKSIDEEVIDLSIKDKNNVNILYMGTMGINRNPYKIIEILNAYSEQNNNISITINFASQDNPFDFIDKNMVKYITINWLGYLSKDDLEVEKENSDVFLLLEDLTFNGNENLTGKIFEYLYAKKPIIVSCNKNSDIVKLLEKCNAGELINSIEKFNNFLYKNRFLNIEETLYYTRTNQYDIFKQFCLDMKE